MADKYDPISLVGKGSFGSVYLVSRRRDGSQFVLKNMQIKNVPEKEIEAYQNEVRLLTELEHPGIVSHVESFIDADKQHMCIVMSYCEGGDLGAYLKHKKGVPMREELILYHFVQMALALLYMHEKNILHRDLKTQNIFIKNSMIQLGDFGISKALTGSNDFAQTCIGTPYYMSPELFANKPYNHKSDVWALGCVLYEMMTYKHAFDATSINGLAQKILRGQINSLPTTYPKSMRNLVKSMLELEPSKRPNITQILEMPFLRKHIKTYVTAILLNESTYPKQNIVNFRAQLKRLDMEELLVQPNTQPQPNNEPVPSLPLTTAARSSSNGKAADGKTSVPSTSRSSAAQPSSNQQQPSTSSSSSALAAERASISAMRHKSSASRLAELQEEESARRALEEKLTKLKKEHEMKLKQEKEKQNSRKAAASNAPSTSSSSAARPTSSGMTRNESKAGLGSKKPTTTASSSSSSAQPSSNPSLIKKTSAGSNSPALGPMASPSSNSSSKPTRTSSGSSSSSSAASNSSSSASSDQRPPHTRSTSRALLDERQRRLDRERKEHEQQLRLREIEELRQAEQARIAEAERLDLRRKQLELIRKKKQEAETAGALQAEREAREREIEKIRLEELSRQKKVYLEQVESERIELERIQLDKEWISKRLQDLESKTGANGAAANGKGSDPHSNASARDRVLAQKAAKRDAAIEAEQAKLLEGRKDAYAERMKVQAKTKGSGVPVHNVASTPASSTSPPRTARYVPDAHGNNNNGHNQHDDEDDSADNPNSSTPPDSSSDADASSDVEDELALEASVIEEAESMLLGLTRRIQDLRTSIQVPAQFEAAEEELADANPHPNAQHTNEEDEYEQMLLMHQEQEQHEQEQEQLMMQQMQQTKEMPVGPEIAENMLARMKALAKTCAKLVGRAKFIDAFEYLKSHFTVPEAQKLIALKDILGEEKLQHWTKIEELVFMERMQQD